MTAMTAARLAEIKRDLGRVGHAITWHSAIVRELVKEVERLQRFEAMFDDCARHRDQAERRAHRYMGIVRQVEELVTEDNDP